MNNRLLLVSIRDNVGEVVYDPMCFSSFSAFERMLKTLPDSNILKSRSSDFDYRVFAYFCNSFLCSGSSSSDLLSICEEGWLPLANIFKE